MEGRPGFDPEELTVLDGEHRLLYLACEGVATDRALATLLARETGRTIDYAEVGVTLEPLVEQRLLLREGRSYLSLGLPAGRTSSGPRAAFWMVESTRLMTADAG